MHEKISLYTFFSLCLCCLFCFSGCGLDEYYVLDAPSYTQNIPTYSSLFDTRYFSFNTYESGMSEYLKSDSAFKFLGTEIYYKIYNNYSTMQSNDSSISSLNSSTNYSSAASAMIETYGFKQLGTSAGTITPLIKATGSNRRVYIRLMNYQSSADFAAKIVVYTDTSETTPDTTFDANGKIPMRSGNKYTFDFGRSSKDTKNAVPADGDTDVTYSSSKSEGYENCFFVDMYAVAVGRDTTYTRYYSHVLHLGAVAIDTTLEDN